LEIKNGNAKGAGGTYFLIGSLRISGQLIFKAFQNLDVRSSEFQSFLAEEICIETGFETNNISSLQILLDTSR